MHLTNPKRICHITSVHPAQDIRIYHKECLSLAENNYEVHLVAAGALQTEHVIYHKLPDITRHRHRLKRMLFRAWSAYRLAKKTNANIFHFHDPELLPYGLWLKWQGYTVIYDAHEDLPRNILTKAWISPAIRPILSWFIEKIENYVARRVDCVIAATPSICHRFKAIGAKSVEVKNFPKLEEITYTNVVFNQQISPAICYVGLISPQRGIFEMVQAATFLGVRLILAGTFVDKKTEMAVKLMDGWQNVDYRGYVDRHGIAKIFAESQLGLCLLHPSVAHEESLPIKLYEYMAAGLPVLASNFKLWQSIIEESGSGYCVDPLKIDDICNIMRKVFLHSTEAKQLGYNGQQIVLAKYNWNKEKENLLDLYRQLSRSH